MCDTQLFFFVSHEWTSTRACALWPSASSDASIVYIFVVCVCKSKKNRLCVCVYRILCHARGICLDNPFHLCMSISVFKWMFECAILRVLVVTYMCVYACVLCVVGGSGCILPAGWDDVEWRWWKVWVREAHSVCCLSVRFFWIMSS